MGAELIRVLAVDDNEFVRDALARKFDGVRGFYWCGALPDATDLLSKAIESRADVVLLDLDMPGPEPIGYIKYLTQAVPECRVVVLSGMLTAGIVDRAIAAGAAGYVSKAEASDTIVNSVQRAAGGEIVLSPEVVIVLRSGAVSQP